MQDATDDSAQPSRNTRGWKVTRFMLVSLIPLVSGAGGIFGVLSDEFRQSHGIVVIVIAIIAIVLVVIHFVHTAWRREFAPDRLPVAYQGF